MDRRQQEMRSGTADVAFRRVTRYNTLKRIGRFRYPGYRHAESAYGNPGANWIRPDRLKCKWRAVVGQRATKKADHNS